MKKLLLTAILLLVAYSLFAQFRDTKWGMSRQEVKRIEGSQIIDEAEVGVIYADKLMGFDVYVLYSFFKDQLSQGSYIFRQKHSNNGLFIEDYEVLKKALDKKYENKVIDKVVWKNDLWKDDRSHWGNAIAMGHLVYRTKWETADTNIYFSLSGDNFEVKMLLTYNSRELEGKVEEQEEKEQESKL